MGLQRPNTSILSFTWKPERYCNVYSNASTTQNLIPIGPSTNPSIRVHCCWRFDGLIFYPAFGQIGCSSQIDKYNCSLWAFASEPKCALPLFNVVAQIPSKKNANNAKAKLLPTHSNFRTYNHNKKYRKHFLDVRYIFVLWMSWWTTTPAPRKPPPVEVPRATNGSELHRRRVEYVHREVQTAEPYRLPCPMPTRAWGMGDTIRTNQELEQ